MSITGKYEVVTEHNIDAVMVLSGVKPEIIEMAKNVKVQVELQDKKDEIAFEFTSRGVTIDQFTVRFDKETAHNTPDGRLVKATMARKPNGGLTQVDKLADGTILNLDYEFNADGLILVRLIGNSKKRASHLLVDRVTNGTVETPRNTTNESDYHIYTYPVLMQL